MQIEIYSNPETDLFDLRVVGSDDWDEMTDLTEKEAQDEAEAISAETGAPIMYQ
jgi:hypothetical protein